MCSTLRSVQFLALFPSSTAIKRNPTWLGLSFLVGGLSSSLLNTDYGFVDNTLILEYDTNEN